MNNLKNYKCQISGEVSSNEFRQNYKDRLAEIEEIVNITASAKRQTLLFSATLGKDLQKIVKISFSCT